MARSPHPSHRPRPSGCIERSQELERDRVARLSVEERILLALSLRERFAGLSLTPRADQGHDESVRPARSR